MAVITHRSNGLTTINRRRRGVSQEELCSRREGPIRMHIRRQDMARARIDTSSKEEELTTTLGMTRTIFSTSMATKSRTSKGMDNRVVMATAVRMRLEGHHHDNGQGPSSIANPRSEETTTVSLRKATIMA